MHKKRTFALLTLFILLPATLLQGEAQPESGNLGLTIAIQESNPLGDYRSFSSIGTGLGLSLDMGLFAQETPLEPLKLKGGINWIFNFTSQAQFTSLQDINWSLGAVYLVPTGEKLTLGGGLYYGGILHLLGIDSLAQGPLLRPFYDQTLSIQGEILLSTGAKGPEIALMPGYQIFFESSLPGHQIYLKAGTRFKL